MKAREVTLPSGKQVEIYEPRGSFAFVALDMAEGNVSNAEGIKRLIEHCVRPKIENWDDFTMQDILVLTREVGEYTKRAQEEANPSTDGTSS